MKRAFPLIIVLCLCFIVNANSEIRLPYFFGDNMVLQQKSMAPIWGEAKPNTIIKIQTSWDKKNYKVQTDQSGKWKLFVSTPSSGGPYEITINETGSKSLKINNVMIGEVWLLTGQSNMEIPLQGYRDQPIYGSSDEIIRSGGKNIHWFKVHRSPSALPLDTVKNSSWKVTGPENAAELSATGWYFAKYLSENLNVPVGLICCYYGGSTVEAWMKPELLDQWKDYQIPVPGGKIESPNRTPTVLYNGMLNPIIGYGIKGCIWYQGESNYIWPERYMTLFPMMIKDWREQWKQGDFPFYYAQIAPYDYAILKESNYRNSAIMRDAQRRIEPELKNSGMIVLLDAGDSICIHPGDKKTVGERFAIMAMTRTYGLKTINMNSPKFKSLEVKGNEIEISFDDAPNGLSTFGLPLTDFEIAGADNVFHPAKARISAAKVLVSSPEVQNPVNVRYAYSDFVKGVLKGVNGMPVSSFSTQDLK